MDDPAKSRVETDSNPPTKGKEAGAEDVINQYDTPEPEPFISFNALKDRIRHHYELASDYYYSLWFAPRTFKCSS